MKDIIGTILFVVLLVAAMYFITGSLGKDIDGRVE